MKLITREQAAKIHGVSIWTFWHYVRKGLIKGHVSTTKKSTGPKTHLWNVEDVIAGIEAVKAYKKEKKRKACLKVVQKTSLFK